MVQHPWTPRARPALLATTSKLALALQLKPECQLQRRYGSEWLRQPGQPLRRDAATHLGRFIDEMSDIDKTGQLLGHGRRYYRGLDGEVKSP